MSPSSLEVSLAHWHTCLLLVTQREKSPRLDVGVAKLLWQSHAAVAFGFGGTCGFTGVPQYSSNSLLLALFTMVSPTCFIAVLAFSLVVSDASSLTAIAKTMSFIAGVTLDSQF